MRSLFNLARRRPEPLRQPVHAEVPELQEANVAAIYYGRRMGGDFYDFLRVSRNRLLFGLLDVAGPMDTNREIVAAAQNTFREVGGELFAGEDGNPAEAMIELCLQVNRSIMKAAGRVHACPVFAGCYDESVGTVVYFNAGHTPGLVRDSGGVSELPATGLPLGLFSHTTCDASTVFLQPGAALLLVSRGIVEAKCGGQELGLDGIKKGLEAASATNSKELCQGVLQRVQEFMCSPPRHDDVTALALCRNTAVQALAATGD